MGAGIVSELGWFVAKKQTGETSQAAHFHVECPVSQTPGRASGRQEPAILKSERRLTVFKQPVVEKSSGTTAVPSQIATAIRNIKSFAYFARHSFRVYTFHFSATMEYSGIQ